MFVIMSIYATDGDDGESNSIESRGSKPKLNENIILYNYKHGVRGNKKNDKNRTRKQKDVFLITKSYKTVL